MSDVFLAYASEDRERAKVLSDALVQRGRTVDWERKIPIGKYYDDVIEPQLAAARCVIALWSARSVAERSVKNEATVALERQKLIPVFIDDVPPPLQFREMQAARLVDWNGEIDSPAFAELDDSISMLLGSAAPAALPVRSVGAHAATSASWWERALETLARRSGTIAAVGAALGVLWAIPKGMSVAWKSGYEYVYRHKAIDRHLGSLIGQDTSAHIVALDSLNLLVKKKPDRALRAYPGVLAYLVKGLPHRRTGADCLPEPPDGRQRTAIASALTFLRENNRGATPDSSVDMSGVELSGADLRGADLRRVNFSRACLAGAKMDSATLNGAIFNDADLRRAILYKANGAPVYFVNAQLDTSTFTEANLPGADFTLASLYGSGFQAAQLQGAVFRRATLGSVNFAGANLTNVPLDHSSDGVDSTDVTGARFDDNTIGLSTTTKTWLRRFGACFDSLGLNRTSGAPSFVIDTACQCATQPVKTCRAGRRPH